MKTMLLLSSITLICFASACSRCQICKKHGSAMERICRDGYNSEAAYNQAIANRVDAGYTCL